jgi:hypothetical protein
VNTLVDMELQRTEDDSAKYLRGGVGAFAFGDPIVMLLVQWHSDAQCPVCGPQSTIHKPQSNPQSDPQSDRFLYWMLIGF